MVVLHRFYFTFKLLAYIKCKQYGPRLDLLPREYTVVVDSKLIVAPIVGFCVCSMFCCTLLFAIILMWKRELVVLF